MEYGKCVKENLEMSWLVLSNILQLIEVYIYIFAE